MKKAAISVITLLISCMLLMPLTVSVSATDLADLFAKDGMGATLGFFGIDINDPESIKKAIDDIQNGGLGSLAGLLGVDINDLLSELQKYLLIAEEKSSSAETTKEHTTEYNISTTAPQITEPSATEPSATEPSETEPSATELTTNKSSSSQNYYTPLPEKTEKIDETTEKAVEETLSTELDSTDTTTEEQTTTVYSNADKKTFEFSEVITLIVLSLVIFVAGLGIGVRFAKKKE